MTRQVDPTRPNQKPGYDQLTFVFFLLKQRRFDLKKKFDLDDLVT